REKRAVRKSVSDSPHVQGLLSPEHTPFRQLVGIRPSPIQKLLAVRRVLVIRLTVFSSLTILGPCCQRTFRQEASQTRPLRQTSPPHRFVGQHHWRSPLTRLPAFRAPETQSHVTTGHS